MKCFPKEFSEILTDKGKEILNGGALNLPQFKISKNIQDYPKLPPLLRLPGVIEPRAAEEMYNLIDLHFKSFFTANQKPLHPLTTHVQRFKSSKKKTYSEKAGTDLSINFKVIYYRNRERDKAMLTAEKFGLFNMQNSESYLKFMTNVTNLKLTAMPDTCQLNMYEHGDHVGLHTDYLATRAGKPVRFVGVHMGMANKYVEKMDFCFQQGKYMSGRFDTVAMGSLAVFVFPFWHSTTPLQAKEGKEKLARRYLHLSALSIKGEPILEKEDLKYL